MHSRHLCVINYEVNYNILIKVNQHFSTKTEKSGKIMARCVVFDFDNTLVQSEKYKDKFFYDIVADVENSKDIMGNILSNLSKEDDRFSITYKFAKLVMEGASPEKIRTYADNLANEYSEKVKDMVSWCEEVKGAEELLSKLKSLSIIAYVNSATPEEGLRESIVKRGWSDYFEGIFGRPASKIENLQKISRLGQFSNTEMVVIGDGDKDRESAEEFCCAFIGVKSDFRPFKKPVECIVNDMTEVFDAMKAM
jgi:phosphoglycolate phosphatase-like HAD superfamily hydrolase